MSVSATLTRDGGISYLEIPTSDLAKSTSFYEKVLGWKIDRRSESDARFQDPACHTIGRFVVGRAASRDAGFLPYAYVGDVRAAAERAASAGGEVVKAPYAEGDTIVATVRDPAGNVVGLWQAR